MKYKRTETVMKCTVWAGVVMLTLFLAQGIVMAEVLKTTLDFGYLVEGDPAEVSVEIENTGSEPIEITNVRTS